MGGAAPAWHCPIRGARPIPGLGLVVASCRAGVLGEGRAAASADRIPARASGRGVTQRALPDWHVLVGSREKPVTHTFSRPPVSVSPVAVSTHTAHPTLLSCAPVHTTHHSQLHTQAEHARHKATQRSPLALSHVARPKLRDSTHRHTIAGTRLHTHNLSALRLGIATTQTPQIPRGAANTAQPHTALGVSVPTAQHSTHPRITTQVLELLYHP